MMADMDNLALLFSCHAYHQNTVPENRDVTARQQYGSSG